MRKLVVPNSFFAEAAEALRNGQSVRLHVDGQSSLEPWSCPFYQWGGNYMIHRFIGMNGDLCQMLGDGNLYRIEEVPKKDIAGILRTIYHADGTEQDCRDAQWIKKAIWWYKLRKIRRFLLPILRLCRV